MDYLYCRTDEPQGKLYDYQPQALKEKTEQSQEMREFIEMCFDPKAPVNKRLKEALFRIMEEGRNEMKAVIYARYSSDNQREESIEGQLRECTAYCKKKMILPSCGHILTGPCLPRLTTARTSSA